MRFADCHPTKKYRAKGLCMHCYFKKYNKAYKPKIYPPHKNMNWNQSASHIPVLIALSNYKHVQKVLEIGSGELSTPLFLDKNVFPDLKTLISVEEDKEWEIKIKELVKEDTRVEFRPTVPVSLYDYDLIFVDGPQNKEKRIKTIHYVLREVIAPIIAVHDSEVSEYQRSFNKIFNKFNFTYMKPWTTIFNKDLIDKKKFKHLHRKININFNKIGDDYVQWKHLLQSK